MHCRDGMKPLMGLEKLGKLDAPPRRWRLAGTDWSNNCQQQGPHKEREKELTEQRMSQGKAERYRIQDIGERIQYAGYRRKKVTPQRPRRSSSNKVQRE